MSQEDDQSKQSGITVVPKGVAVLSEIETHYRDYLDSLPPKLAQRIQQQQMSLQHGMYTTSPLMCGGPTDCKIVSFCPIPDRIGGKVDYGDPSLYPIGRQCVVERLFVQTKTVELAQYLNVDPSNPIEMSIIGDLALIDLQKHRLNMLMSNGDRDGQGKDFIRYDSKGFTENGAPIEDTKVHPWMDLYDRLEKRRQSHLDRLMATRKAKADLASRMGDAHDGKLVREIEALREAIAGLATQKTQVDIPGERLMLDDED